MKNGGNLKSSGGKARKRIDLWGSSPFLEGYKPRGWTTEGKMAKTRSAVKKKKHQNSQIYEETTSWCKQETQEMMKKQAEEQRESAERGRNRRKKTEAAKNRRTNDESRKGAQKQKPEEITDAGTKNRDSEEEEEPKSGRWGRKRGELHGKWGCEKRGNPDSEHENTRLDRAIRSEESMETRTAERPRVKSENSRNKSNDWRSIERWRKSVRHVHPGRRPFRPPFTL